METTLVKKIVKNVIKLVFVEMGWGLLLGLLSTFKKILETVVGQGAATAEIQRLNGEVPLVVTEALMNYNNNLHLISNGLIFVIIILMVYSAYKAVMKILKEDSSESSK